MEKGIAKGEITKGAAEENAPKIIQTYISENIEPYDKEEFDIYDTRLNKYKGTKEVVKIPNGVETILTYAFKEAKSVKVVIIPDSVKKLNNRAFYGCSNLTSVKIGKGLKDYCTEVFSYCYKLQNITVSPDNKTFHSINNCMIETAKKQLVLGCVNSVIPKDGSVCSIGPTAFQGCSELKKITIPVSVKRVCDLAFADCDNLRKVKYTGKKEQWKKVEKPWHFLFENSFRNCTVHCSDGKIK